MRFVDVEHGWTVGDRGTILSNKKRQRELAYITKPCKSQAAA